MAEASENIAVVVRIRGLIAREKDQAKAFIAEDSSDVVQRSNSKKWTFDRVYGPKDNTRSVRGRILTQRAQVRLYPTVYTYGNFVTSALHKV